MKLSSFARARMRPSDDTNESCFVLFCFVSCRVGVGCRDDDG